MTKQQAMDAAAKIPGAGYEELRGGEWRVTDPPKGAVAAPDPAPAPARAAAPAKKKQ